MSLLPKMAEPASRFHLLIIDSEANGRAPLAQALRQKGYQVAEVGSGQEALTRIEQTLFDLMVLDLAVSGTMSGVDIMLRARLMRRDLPMIVLTAQPTIESAVAAVKADVVDYMLKPYKIEDLLLAISRALEERAQQLRQQQLLEMVGEAMELLRRTDTSAEKAALPSITASQNQTTNIGDVSGQATVTHLDPPNGRTATTATRAQPLDLKRGTGADAPHGYGTEYEAQGESAFKGASSVHLLHAGPLALDRQKRLVTVSTNPVRTVELTESEVSILLTLMQKPNQVFSYNQLAKSALGYEGMDKWTVESVIRSSVFRLRQKIEPGPDAPRLICTVRGRGYYFSPSGAKAN